MFEDPLDDWQKLLGVLGDDEGNDPEVFKPDLSVLPESELSEERLLCLDQVEKRWLKPDEVFLFEVLRAGVKQVRIARMEHCTEMAISYRKRRLVCIMSSYVWRVLVGDTEVYQKLKKILTKRQMEVIFLFESRFKKEKVASILGIHYMAVAQRMQRALERIRLAGQQDDEFYRRYRIFLKSILPGQWKI